jgi:hypothetical protein
MTYQSQEPTAHRVRISHCQETYLVCAASDLMLLAVKAQMMQTCRSGGGARFQDRKLGRFQGSLLLLHV